MILKNVKKFFRKYQVSQVSNYGKFERTDTN